MGILWFCLASQGVPRPQVKPLYLDHSVAEAFAAVITGKVKTLFTRARVLVLLGVGQWGEIKGGEARKIQGREVHFFSHEWNWKLRT